MSRNGFDSNLYFIKEYCIGLCEYVRDHHEYKNYFKNNISQMISYDLEALLKIYRQNNDSIFFGQLAT
jgi:hypothetical protein